MSKATAKTRLRTVSAGAGAGADRQGRLKQAIQRVRELESEMGAIVRGMQEKVLQLEYLADISAMLNSTLEPAQVREKALEATCRLLKCETASLLLVDRKAGELYWETALGEAGKVLQQGVRLPINDRSIAGYVAMSGEGLVINDVQRDPRFNRKATAKSGFVTRNMICLPLKLKERTIGVLQAINKLPEVAGGARTLGFNEQDRRWLEALSHPIAIAIENSQLYSSLKKGFYDTVEALAESIEKKDHYTGGHTKRVVHYSMSIAKYMDLSPEQQEQLRLGAVLHDVGKIGIEDSVLKKGAALDPAEWKVMQRHPELGYDILRRVEALGDVIGAMRYHHERWDGKGYPLGLKGEEIPLIARIIAVADTYDAMVSTRPYRKGLDPKIAFEEIVRYRGTQFDPAVVDAFVQAFERDRMGKGATKPGPLANCD